MQDLQVIYDVNGFTRLRLLNNPFGLTHLIYRDFLRRNLKLKPGDKVLDAGCGYGLVSKAIHQNAASQGIEIEQYAFDISESMPEAFQDYVQAPVNLKCADARNTGYPDETFDIIICSGMFEHIDNPTEVLAEFRRCLKNDGQLLVLISQKIPPVRLALRLLFNAGTYYYEEFLPFVKEAGFAKIERRLFPLHVILFNFCLFALYAKK